MKAPTRLAGSEEDIEVKPHPCIFPPELAWVKPEGGPQDPADPEYWVVVTRPLPCVVYQTGAPSPVGGHNPRQVQSYHSLF